MVSFLIANEKSALVWIPDCPCLSINLILKLRNCITARPSQLDVLLRDQAERVNSRSRDKKEN